MHFQLAYFNANATEGLPSVPAKLLHLRIISGQNFPKPRGGGMLREIQMFSFFFETDLCVINCSI